MHSPPNKMSACEWRLESPDSISLFMRAVKSLSLVDSAITMVLRTDKLDLYAESQDSSCALMASFPGACFRDFRVPEVQVLAVDAAALRGILLPGKRAMLSIYFTIRNSEFCDFAIDYITGVRGAYGLPLLSPHSAFQGDCPEIGLYDAWMSARAEFFSKHIVALFPGELEFLALTMSISGLSLRNFDYEKQRTGRSGHPINLPNGLIPVFSPKKEVEITSIPYKRLRIFIETAVKCEQELQFVPDLENGASQCILQSYKEPGKEYFTLLLGCDIRAFSSIKTEARVGNVGMTGKAVGRKTEDYFDVKAYRVKE